MAKYHPRSENRRITNNRISESPFRRFTRINSPIRLGISESAFRRFTKINSPIRLCGGNQG